MIRILIAEDSHVMARILRSLFDAEPDLEVIGVARDGQEAVEMAARLKPDIITMDVIMPKMDGVEATRQIMERTPTPIVVISSHVNDKEMQITFRSLAAGALNVLGKPTDVNAPRFDSLKRLYVSTIRDMASIKVARRVSDKREMRELRPRKPDATVAARREIPVGKEEPDRKYRIVLIGSSTGGPQALKHILGAMPANYPAPVLIAQHITRGFGQGMVDWLNRSTPMTVKTAEDGETCKAGVVYFAPDGRDVGISGTGDVYRIQISEERPPEKLTPSVDYLFESAARADCRGVVCGLLTGMGRDGAKGMLAVREQHGHTFAQAEESCIVFGMPDAALKANATDRALMLEVIPGHLRKLVSS